MTRSTTILAAVLALAAAPSRAQAAADPRSAEAPFPSAPGACAVRGAAASCSGRPGSGPAPIGPATPPPSPDAFVAATAQGVRCDMTWDPAARRWSGGSDDGPAIAGADALAKRLGAALLFPGGKGCLVRTGFLVDTGHTHWRSLGGTTIAIDPNATVVGNAEGGTGALLFSDFSDLLLDGITFQGAGQGTRTCGSANTACGGRLPRTLWQNVDGIRMTRGGFVDFGAQAVSGGPAGTYIQGLLGFGLSNFRYSVANSPSPPR